MKSIQKLSASLLSAFIFTFGGAAFLQLRFPRKYAEEIKFYSEKYGPDENLILSIVKAESGFKPDKISPKGAAGLMQIMPETSEYIGKRFFSGKIFNLFDPSENIEVGCFYLFYLKEKFENTTEILAAYNAGEGNVKLWKNMKGSPLDADDIPFPETKIYVKKVLSYYRIYNLLYD